MLNPHFDQSRAQFDDGCCCCCCCCCQDDRNCVRTLEYNRRHAKKSSSRQEIEGRQPAGMDTIPQGLEPVWRQSRADDSVIIMAVDSAMHSRRWLRRCLRRSICGRVGWVLFDHHERLDTGLMARVECHVRLILRGFRIQDLCRKRTRAPFSEISARIA